MTTKTNTNTADAAKIAAEDAYYDAPLNRVAAVAALAAIDDVYFARLNAALQLEDRTYSKHESARLAYRNRKADGTPADIAVAADEVEYRWTLCQAATARVNAVRATAPNRAAYFAK